MEFISKFGDEIYSVLLNQEEIEEIYEEDLEEFPKRFILYDEYDWTMELFLNVDFILKLGRERNERNITKFLRGIKEKSEKI